jgi:hypothetical protein
MGMRCECCSSQQYVCGHQASLDHNLAHSASHTHSFTHTLTHSPLITSSLAFSIASATALIALDLSTTKRWARRYDALRRVRVRVWYLQQV